MRWRHANLVDPEFRARFVVLDRDNEMVSKVTKERIGHTWIDWIVKNTRGNIHQNTLVIACQNLDFDGHWTVSFHNRLKSSIPPAKARPLNDHLRQIAR